MENEIWDKIVIKVDHGKKYDIKGKYSEIMNKLDAKLVSSIIGDTLKIKGVGELLINGVSFKAKAGIIELQAKKLS